VVSQGEEKQETIFDTSFLLLILFLLLTGRQYWTSSGHFKCIHKQVVFRSKVLQDMSWLHLLFFKKTTCLTFKCNNDKDKDDNDDEVLWCCKRHTALEGTRFTERKAGV